jgi:tRNA A-37 threonylcarbamoyl transferase component Bud32
MTMLKSGLMAADETASTKQNCPACGATIDTSACEPLSRIACPQCGEKIRVERAFDNFLILETLGIGGMGTVYKARDTHLDREVALKLLREDLGAEFDQAARLQQEARVAASVNHPNVIQVFSSGTDHGKFYLVMELVDRGSLDDLIEERKQLPEDLVVQTGIQVAKGLRAAYAKGLIHRDVKPANILFADEHTAKIGDFGLAGVAAEQSGDEIWGTPYYVAPERLKNEPEDFRSDIYSLGATLFHALTGRAPIEGETNSAIALRELKENPLDLRKTMPEVSAETARVFQRMIAPAAARRFASYDELVAGLERAYSLLTGEGEFVVKKSKARWVTGAVVLGFALVAVGLWAFLAHRHAQRTVSDVAARAERLVTLAPLEAQAVEARRQIVQGHHNVGREKFGQIAAAAKGRQPFYDWARLQEALAAMIGRDPSEAQRAFHDVANAGNAGFSREDDGLAAFFTETAKTMATTAPVTSAALRTTGNGAEVFALLLGGMKDMAQADVADAIPLLDRFMTAQPDSKFSWIAEYKPLAQKYLEDCRVYLSWKSESEAGASASARLDKVRRARSQLKVRSSPMSDGMSAEEKRLATEAARDQKTGSPAPTERPGHAEPASRGKAQWLAQWRTQLSSDLNTTHYAGPVSDVTGTQYTGIMGASEAALKMKLAYGEVEVPWAKLSPKTLLTVTLSFIAPNAPDAADRQWLAAAYASETGNVADARRLAESAAKLKPEYQQEMPLLFPR